MLARIQFSLGHMGQAKAHKPDFVICFRIIAVPTIIFVTALLENIKLIWL